MNVLLWKVSILTPCPCLFLLLFHPPNPKSISPYTIVWRDNLTFKKCSTDWYFLGSLLSLSFKHINKFFLKRTFFSNHNYVVTILKWFKHIIETWANQYYLKMWNTSIYLSHIVQNAYFRQIFLELEWYIFSEPEWTLLSRGLCQINQFRCFP